MHINVRNFLVESIGYSRSYKIEGENPELESVVLTQSVGGDVTISKIEEASLLVEGRMNAAIQLECHRCLRTFTRPVHITLRQLFALKPKDDDMPITGDNIDLAPIVEQEIILSLPIKILDRPDCPGIQALGGDDQSPGTSLKHRARIIKER